MISPKKLKNQCHFIFYFCSKENWKEREVVGIVCIGETSIAIGMGSVKIFFGGQRGMESAFEEFSIEKEGRGCGRYLQPHFQWSGNLRPTQTTWTGREKKLGRN